jgi:hypothetical protein
VTSDQLRAKAGKVRCGYCQTVFNAFDGLVGETAEPVHPVAGEELPESSSAQQLEEFAAIRDSEQELAPAADVVVSASPADTESVPTDSVTRELDEIAAELGLAATDVAPPRIRVSATESAQESNLAARQAGLVAARELSETPAYDRWAAGTLAGAGGGGFAGAPARRTAWHLVLAALLLLGLLLAQIAHYFRSDLVRVLPVTADIFAALDVPVPLPQQSDLVSIESSDLQVDNARGLFILDASLRNRAAYAQAWPALELTLTDAGDVPVARRVMTAADYLPPGSDLSAFPANAETPVRMWIDAKGLGASGYRLYIFYP